MTTYDLIRQAILNKQCVTCTYNDYLRKMTPHVIGEKMVNSKLSFINMEGNQVLV